MVETDALGPWRRAGGQHILLNWKQQQSGHKDIRHLPSSPFTAFHKPLLPPPPAFPEHCCPGTACGSCIAPQQQVCQHAPGHPGSPLSHRPCGFHTSAHSLVPRLLIFQPPTSPSHPFPGCCLGLSIISSTREKTFHEALKHPQSPSPGRPEPCYKQECPSSVKLGTDP